MGLVVPCGHFDEYPSSCWSVEVRPSHIAATTFPPRSPVAISDRTTSSASSGGLDAYNSGLACVLYSFATHLARALGFPDCPLSVSAHPVLMGAFPVSRRHTSLWGPSCTACGNGYIPLLHVLPWRTVPDQASRLCCPPNASLPPR